MSALQHRLSAVWFADIVGYSGLAGEDEAAALHLVDLLQALSRDAVGRRGGRIVKFMGDGALAEFPSTEAAVRAAHALMTAFASRSREAGGEGTLRIGVHVGDVAAGQDGDLYGDGVNVAARLQAEAEPGQVLVSEDVWRQLRPRREFAFTALGERSLKGMATRVAVYSASIDPASEAAEPTKEPTGSGPVRPAGARPSTASGQADRASQTWIPAARLVRILAIYVLAAAALLLGTGALRRALDLPDWVTPVAVVLLAIGFLVVLATAWVQSHPLTAGREAEEAVPGRWEIALGELGRSVTRGEVPHLTWARAILGGAVAFSLLFGAAGLYVIIQDRGRSFTPADAIAEDAAPGIAVLPFTVNGPGLDVWREGVIDLVSTNIDGAGGLRAIDSRTVLARWSEVVQGSETPDLEAALEVGRRTGARYALLGTATELGTDVRLVADIYDLTSGRSLGRTQIQGVPDSVYQLVDRLSIGVLETVLAGKPEALPQVNLARVTTTSLPALKAYLEGEALYRRSDFDAAIPVFQRAVEADSTFALAHYRLSLSYGWSQTIASDLSTYYLEQAARYVGRLPEREAILIRASLALERGTLDGFEPLRQGVRKYPDDVELWFTLGETYFHLGPSEMVDDAQHDAPWERAIELDPELAPLYIHPTEIAFFRADSARATRFGREYLRLAPTGEFAPAMRHTLALLWGDEAARAQARATLDTLSTQDGLIALLYLQHARSLPLAAELADLLRRRPDWDWAEGRPRRHVWTYLHRGDLTSALETLDDPRTERDFREDRLFLMHLLGFPVAPERLTEIAAFGPADTLPGFKPFFVAVQAAEEGRWPEFARAAARLQRDAQRLRADGDSIRLRTTQGLIQAMDGYAALRRGEREKARTLLEVARRETNGHGEVNDVKLLIQIWLGTLAVEEDRLADAERYLRNGVYWLDRPFVADRLGQVYERMGERGKAREAYELFVTAWRDADPALQPRVEAARQALYRLGFGRRG
jgi:class 3 adenylate cyclase/tetratricopeptide (TPR) repeat protein